MARFKDTKGDEWEFDITVATLRRVRGVVQNPDGSRFELMDLASPGSPTYQRVMKDPVELCDVLFVVCDRQARERSVDADAFGERLAGDSLAAAIVAFLEALASFSPSPAIRAALGKEMRALMAATENVHRRLDAAIDESSLTANLEAAYEASLKRTTTGATEQGDGAPTDSATGSSASGAPPSSGSNHGASPSASSS